MFHSVSTQAGKCLRGALLWCLSLPSGLSDELGGSGKLGFSVVSGLCVCGAVRDRSKGSCDDRRSSKILQWDCEKALHFVNQSRCGTSAVGTLLVVHEELNSGPKWTTAKGSNETVRPLRRLLGDLETPQSLRSHCFTKLSGCMMKARCIASALACQGDM